MPVAVQGQEGTPQVWVFPSHDMVQGIGWPTGAQITVTGNSNDDLTVVVNADGSWGLWTYPVAVGDVIVATASTGTGTVTRSVTVTSVEITSVDLVTDVVTGHGFPGTELSLLTNQPGDTAPTERHVTVGFDGSWSEDFSAQGAGGEAIVDIVPCGDVTADDHEDDGDMTRWKWVAPCPTLQVSVDNDQASGHGWQADTSISLTIDGTGFGTNSDGNGDWWLDLQPYDVQPGQSVVATDGLSTKTLLVANLSVTNIDGALDLISGTATPNGSVDVVVGGQPDSRHATVNAEGLWTADFSQSVDGQDPFDIKPGNGGAVFDKSDDDGDITMVDWRLPEAPSFEVIVIDPHMNGFGREADQVEGRNWVDDQVLVTVHDGLTYNPSSPADSVLFSVTVDTENWGDTRGFNAQLVDEGWNRFDVRPGEVVRVEGLQSGEVADHHVLDLTVTGVDIHSDVVSGTAPDGTEVLVQAYGWSGGNHQEMTVTSSGTWSADFSGMADISGGRQGRAVVYDDSGNGTAAPWLAALAGVRYRSGDPHVFGLAWFDDSTVDIALYQDDTAQDPYLEIPSVPVGEEMAGHFQADLDGLDPEPGNVITFLGDTGTARTLTVGDLTLNPLDIDAGIATGTSDRSPVRVDLQWPEGSAIRVVAVEEGGFVADFRTEDNTGYLDFEGRLPEGQSPTEWNISVESYDEEGNWTTTGFGTDGGPSAPTLFGSAYGHEYVEGLGWAGDETVHLELDNPLCAGFDVGTGDGHFYVDAPNFGEFCDLAPGLTITATGNESGTVATLMISEVVVTDVNANADTVSGHAAPMSEVQVIAWGEEGHGAQRTVSADESGAWMADLGSLPDTPGHPDDVGVVDLTEGGPVGAAYQYNEDGHATQSDWWVPSPALYVNPIRDFVIVEDFAPSSPVTITVAAEDGTELARETLTSPDPYFAFSVATDLGNVDLLSGFEVVASQDATVRTHTVTQLSITTVDFLNDTVHGRAFPGASVDVEAYHDAGYGFVETAADELGAWSGNFAGQLDFPNRIGVTVTEYDDDRDATFFWFEAAYVSEHLTGGTPWHPGPDPGPGNPGSPDVDVPDNFVGTCSLVESDAVGAADGFRFVGEQMTIECVDPSGDPWKASAADPFVVRFHLYGPELGVEDVNELTVFKNEVAVPECPASPDYSHETQACVSDRTQDGDSMDITVWTLTLSHWTVGVRHAELRPLTGLPEAPVELQASGAEVIATAVFYDRREAGYRAIWDWGDGTEDTDSISIGELTAEHTYAAPGVYRVQLAIEESIGDDVWQPVADRSFEYVVVYDPDGGFVTGGGWIDSPAGAYAANPTLTGKATFGFVSKYKKGAMTPTGNTEFVFHAADLEFHSDSYDWLVIAGHKAMYKGTGTINGGGNFGFMLSAIDAALTPSTDVDLFRIKIWDKNDGDTVVYDNLIGEGDDADPTTALGGGSIVIHKAVKNAN